MNARARQARRTIRQRRADNALRASLKRGRAIATHALAAGIPEQDVQGFAAALVKQARKIGVTPAKVARTRNTVGGKGGRKARLRIVYHFTAAQVHVILGSYKPRKAEYKAAKLVLAA